MRRGDERGSVVVLVALMIVVILGMAAFAVDLGRWWVVKHQEQSAVDAAALAGAHDLPDNPSQAIADAQDYFTRNMPGTSAQVTTPFNGDTKQIHVEVRRDVPSLFASVLGVNSASVDASATAQRVGGTGPLTTAYWIAPMAVSGSCGGSGTAPCVGTYTPSGGATFNYIAYHHLGSCTGSTYSFCFTNLSSTAAWKESATYDQILASWIRGGYPTAVTAPLETGDYQTIDCKSPCTDTSGYSCGHNAAPASCILIQALVAKPGDILLVPVFNPSKTKSLGHFYLQGFAVFQLNVNPAMIFYNRVDAAHWWITGNYLTNIDCQSPPADSGSTPSDFGSVCYGTSSGGTGSGDYGVGTAGRSVLTQ
jgi:Flp pilus assembly protein TadG